MVKGNRPFAQIVPSFPGILKGRNPSAKMQAKAGVPTWTLARQTLPANGISNEKHANFLTGRVKHCYLTGYLTAENEHQRRFHQLAPDHVQSFSHKRMSKLCNSSHHETLPTRHACSPTRTSSASTLGCRRACCQALQRSPAHSRGFVLSPELTLTHHQHLHRPS